MTTSEYMLSVHRLFRKLKRREDPEERRQGPKGSELMEGAGSWVKSRHDPLASVGSDNSSGLGKDRRAVTKAV